LPGTGPGNVRALAVTGTTLYVATDRGRVFRSTNSGTTWSAVGGILPNNASIKALAVDLFTPGKLFAASSGGVFDIEPSESAPLPPTSRKGQRPRTPSHLLLQSRRPHVRPSHPVRQPRAPREEQ
jgi:hypothetical protein